MAPEELILRLDQEIEAELHPFTVGGAPSAELDAAKAQRRSYALRTIKRYLEFLLIIQGRNTVASANYLDNVRQQLEEIDRQVERGSQRGLRPSDQANSGANGTHSLCRSNWSKRASTSSPRCCSTRSPMQLACTSVKLADARTSRTTP